VEQPREVEQTVSRKKSELPATRSGINWRQAVAGAVPVEPLFEEPLEDEGDVEDAMEAVLDYLESGAFLTWEAVLSEEQGLTLSRAQREALEDLMSFSGEPDERVLYLNGVPRPTEPWYASIRKIASALLVERFDTSKSHFGSTTEGWPMLVEAIEDNASSLSLPPGVALPIEVVSEPMRHALWVQSCFSTLEGLGQAPHLSLKEQPTRVADFLEALQQVRDSVAFLGWTLGQLLDVVVLPPDDRKRLVASFKTMTGIGEHDLLSSALSQRVH
jgi:hypothetical protein